MEGHSNIVVTVAFSADGKYIVSGSYDRTVRMWDAETGDPVGEPLIGHSDPVECVAFSGDTCIKSASLDGTVRIWDVEMLGQVEEKAVL